MILRPVSPQSACGPPSSNAPVGLTSTSKSSSANCSGTVGLMTCSMRSLRIWPSMSMPGPCWLEISTVVSAFGLAVLVDDAHLGLAVGAQVVEHALLAHLGQPAGEAVREPDRHRHEVVGLVAGVAEHHPLVAGADLVVVVGEPSRISLALSTPLAMSGDCSSIDVMTAQVLPSNP